MHDDDGDHLHPRERPSKPDDPMQLDAIEVSGGDPAIMLDCLVEEFARLGWDADMMLGIFTQPFYAGTYGLNLKFGEDAIRRRIEQTLARCGTMRYRAVEHDLPLEFSDPPFDEGEDDHGRVALTIGGRPIA